jgi:hypothetical protein
VQTVADTRTRVCPTALDPSAWSDQALICKSVTENHAPLTAAFTIAGSLRRRDGWLAGMASKSGLATQISAASRSFAMTSV